DRHRLAFELVELSGDDLQAALRQSYIPRAWVVDGRRAPCPGIAGSRAGGRGRFHGCGRPVELQTLRGLLSRASAPGALLPARPTLTQRAKEGHPQTEQDRRGRLRDERDPAEDAIGEDITPLRVESGGEVECVRVEASGSPKGKPPETRKGDRLAARVCQC